MLTGEAEASSVARFGSRTLERVPTLDRCIVPTAGGERYLGAGRPGPRPPDVIGTRKYKRFA